MSLIYLNNESHNGILDRNFEGCNLIDEFGDVPDIIQLTNIFKLRVEKAQNLLGHLKESIEAKFKSGDQIERKLLDDIGSGDITSIKDKLGKFSDILITKSVFINQGQLIPMSDILHETCVLVTHLDNDCSSMQVQIIKQKNKVNDLLSKIQNLSYIRMENLASAVQSEHEACSNDISELQWHIKHRSTIERKICDKRNKAADINAQLNEEIDEIKEYIPLVQEKLLLEEDMLKKIEEIKQGLVTESDASTERMRITASKHAESSKKAETERQHRKRDLHKCNKTLVETQKSLQHAIKEHKKMEDYKLRCEDKIRKNHQQIAKLNSDNDGKMLERNIVEELVGKLEARMREVAFDNQRLNKSLSKEKSELSGQEEDQNGIMRSCTDKRDELHQEMVTLRRGNNQMEIEIDAIKDSREKCVLDIEKLREKIVTTKVDITEAEEGFEDAIKEFTVEAKKHSVVKQRLANRMRETQEIEDKLRHSLAEIEAQIKQEIMTKTTVKSKMTTDTLDLENSKKEALEKQKQMKKMLKEGLALLNDMRVKVEDVTGQYRKCNEELRTVQNDNAKILADRDAMRAEKQGRIDELTPVFDGLKGRIDALVQKEEHVQWQVRTMNTQLGEMEASETLICTGKKKTQEALLGTEREYNRVWIELDMNRRHQDRLTTAISQTVCQANRMRTAHLQYLQERQEALEQAQREFDRCLVINGNLAKQYRSLQTDLHGMQESYLDMIQDHLRTEESVKDVKEIQRLQKHMHNCTDAFFTMKLLYDEDQYRYLKRICGRNVSEIEQLKSEYIHRIESMKTFLTETFPRESQWINAVE